MTIIDQDGDARSSPRDSHGLETGLIRFGQISVCCALQNFSETGAALIVGPDSFIPDCFKLIVVRRRTVLLCKVVWRRGSSIGVSFSEQIQDRRKSQRQNVRQAAYVSHKGFCTRCEIINISPEGAAIEVVDATSIPKQFKLMTADDRVIRDCRTVWIKQNRLGIEFENATAMRPPLPSAATSDADSTETPIRALFAWRGLA